MRSIQYAAAYRLNRDVCEILDHPPSRVMTVTDQNFKQPRLRGLAACLARVFPETFLPSNQRAQGMPGARRTRSLACENKNNTRVSHHGHTGTTRRFPAQCFT